MFSEENEKWTLALARMDWAFRSKRGRALTYLCDEDRTERVEDRTLLLRRLRAS